jgi:hypothetical protein
VRKHLRGIRGLDPRSSAAWFTGWRAAITAPPGQPPVAAARTWLASVGWRRHGLIGVDETPRPRAGNLTRSTTETSPSSPAAGASPPPS